MAEPFVRVEHVSKTVKGQTLLEDINLHVRQGEIVALCGGNGAGKSTFIRTLAGIQHPDRGRISIAGRSWKEDRKRYAELIGYMPDDYRFSTGLTAMESMMFWAKLKGLQKQHASDALREVGLADTGAKPVASFSKGMRQRVLFAQAMLADPPLLVMDEPTNGLDPYWMESFAHLVRKAAGRGQTVIFSTHQLSIAEALADRLVFIRSGRVIFDGTQEDFRKTGAAGLRELFGVYPL